MKKLDEILNNFTMYKVVLYGLLFLAAISIALSFSGLVPFNPLSMVLSLLLIGVACFISNDIIARILKVKINIESWAITGLILFFILTPIDSVEGVIFIVLTSIVAMASKYIFAPFKRHIFNPAAIALVILGIFGSPYAEWWVGNTYLFPFVLVIGIFIVRKVRKFQLFLSYALTAAITIGLFAFKNGLDAPSTVLQAVTSWPFLFLGTVMLTEPLTMPPRKNHQLLYGALVGILSGAQFNLGPLHSTSEFALVAGNVFAYLIGFKYRLVLTLREKIKLSPSIYEFVFSNDRHLNFKAGQYMEWTVNHRRPDGRGTRRYFTISSSPTEKDIRLGVKIDPQRQSSFKKTLLNLKEGDRIYANQLAGDFVIPLESNSKYVFIAGGVGITPFRSIVKSLIDNKKRSDIVLFYASSDPTDFVYKEVFVEGKNFGVKTVYICSKPPVNWQGKTGRLNAEIIKEEVSDWQNRTYYISGPNALVHSYKKLLGEIGIQPHKIVTDYFPGF